MTAQEIYTLPPAQLGYAIGKVRAEDGTDIFGIIWLTPPCAESWCWPTAEAADRAARQSLADAWVRRNAR